jgi:phosphoesterase RecJ-like protein
MFWDTKAAATAELIFDLIVLMGDELLIDSDIADCLYAGILTDTGSFRHPSTTHKVHITIAQLIDLGANASRVHKLIYDTNSENRLRFMGYILLNKLVVLREYNTAYITITKDELKQYDSKTGDTEGFVNYALSIEGIKFGIIIVDRTEAVKISFRSVGEFSVNDFARKNFEGGGHRNAAGGKSSLSLEETVAKFLALLPEYKDQLTTPV